MNVPFASVSVKSEGKSLGRVYHPLWPFPLQSDAETDEVAARIVEAEVIVACAGPLAEARRKGERLPRKPHYRSSDLIHALESLESCGITLPASSVPLLDRMWEKTRELLQQPDVWAAVTALAEELLKRKEMSEVQAWEITARALGRKPPKNHFEAWASLLQGTKLGRELKKQARLLTSRMLPVQQESQQISGTA